MPTTHKVKPSLPNKGQHKLSVLDESQALKPVTAALVFDYRIDETRLAKAIEQLLSLYPFLSGSLRTKPFRIELDQSGIQLVVSKSHQRPSAAFGSNNRITDLRPQLEWTQLNHQRRVLLAVELVHFACGGSGLKVSTIHAVFDARALMHFVSLLAKCFVDGSVPDCSGPSVDRAVVRATGPPEQLLHHNEYRYHIGWFTALFKYLEVLWHAMVVFLVLPRNAFTPREFSVPATACQMIHFTAPQLKALKSVLSKTTSPHAVAQVPYVSTQDCLTALIVALITRARSTRANIGPLVAINTTVNGRTRLDPQIPSNYSGNATLYANSRYPTNMFLWPRDSRVRKEASARGLATIARGIRKSVLGMTPSYCQDAINVLATKNAVVKFPHNLSVDSEFGPDVLVSSWCGSGLMEGIDFGGGRPVYAGPSVLNEDGSIVLLNSCDGKAERGVDVVVCLRPEDAVNFFAELEEEWVKEILELQLE
ncbi:transferase family-domain-containing protein [Obelidium mucronatum]|nr:transferase family-domain-containing protein [Obelidium mucronatum]